MKFEMGKWYTVKGVAYKFTEGTPARKYVNGNFIEDDTKPSTYPLKTDWKRDEISPTKAMYIGYRMVHEGVTYKEWDDDGVHWHPQFEHKKSLKVLLFVEKENRNSFYVFPEDVEIS
jgi:hypothetical protein